MRQVYRSADGKERAQAWCRAGLARWEVPHDDHELQTSLGSTHVTTLGDGPRTCVFLPGTNFNAATSIPFLSALATRFSVVAADLPGQPGLSAPERPRDEIAGYAGWVDDLLRWVVVRHPRSSILLAGHSRGAAVALTADPGSVAGLALLSPAGLTDVRPTLPMLTATVPWLTRRNAPSARSLLRLMSAPGHEPAPDLIDWMTLVARACHTTGAPGRHDERIFGGWRDHAVTIMVGAHDAFFPHARLRQASLDALGVEPVVVIDAGHLLLEEQPTTVAARLAEM